MIRLPDFGAKDVQVNVELLFDEPTSALDPEMVSEVLLVIRDHGAQRPDAASASRTRWVSPAKLRIGSSSWTRSRILERATPEDFFERPQHPRAQQFLSDLRSPFARSV